MKKKEELLSIIEEGRIHPVFQPIVSLRDGQIIGYEALSRIDGKTKIQDMEEFFQLGFKQNYTKKQLEKRGIASEKIVIEVTERNTIQIVILCPKSIAIHVEGIE